MRELTLEEQELVAGGSTTDEIVVTADSGDDWGDWGDWGDYGDYGDWYGDGGGGGGGSDSGAGTVSVGAEGSGSDLEVKSTANIANESEQIVATYDDIVVIARNLGLPTPVITSGNDGSHMSGSLHYTDNAIDIRANNITDAQAQQFADQLAASLGTNYDVQFEHFPGNESNDHIHIEYDPNP
jgi:hypothetical protein